MATLSGLMTAITRGARNSRSSRIRAFHHRHIHAVLALGNAMRCESRMPSACSRAAHAGDGASRIVPAAHVFLFISCSSCAAGDGVVQFQREISYWRGDI